MQKEFYTQLVDLRDSFLESETWRSIDPSYTQEKVKTVFNYLDRIARGKQLINSMSEYEFFEKTEDIQKEISSFLIKNAGEYPDVEEFFNVAKLYKTLCSRFSEERPAQFESPSTLNILLNIFRISIDGDIKILPNTQPNHRTVGIELRRFKKTEVFSEIVTQDPKLQDAVQTLEKVYSITDHMPQNPEKSLKYICDNIEKHKDSNQKIQKFLSSLYDKIITNNKIDFSKIPPKYRPSAAIEPIVGAHNSYNKGLLGNQVYDIKELFDLGVRHFELDVGYEDGDIKVRHFFPGSKLLTSSKSLKNYLAQIKEIRTEHPDEAISIKFEVNQLYGDGDKDSINMILEEYKLLLDDVKSLDNGFARYSPQMSNYPKENRLETLSQGDAFASNLGMKKWQITYNDKPHNSTNITNNNKEIVPIRLETDNLNSGKCPDKTITEIVEDRSTPAVFAYFFKGNLCTPLQDIISYPSELIPSGIITKQHFEQIQLCASKRDYGDFPLVPMLDIKECDSRLSSTSLVPPNSAAEPIMGECLEDGNTNNIIASFGSFAGGAVNGFSNHVLHRSIYKAANLLNSTVFGIEDEKWERTIQPAISVMISYAVTQSSFSATMGCISSYLGDKAGLSSSQSLVVAFAVSMAIAQYNNPQLGDIEEDLDVNPLYIAASNFAGNIIGGVAANKAVGLAEKAYNAAYNSFYNKEKQEDGHIL